METAVYTMAGEKIGAVRLPERVFGLPWNGDLVRQVVHVLSSHAHGPWAHVKDRSEVRGGGKKPWRQKGTGRARHGSIRSPLWRGGGITHGPQRRERRVLTATKKMKQKALWTVLSAKARENEIIVVEELLLGGGKTKEAAAALGGLARVPAFAGIKRGNGVLVASVESNAAAKRALRNIPYAGIAEVRNLNVQDALAYKFIMLSKQAVATLAK